MVMASYRKFYSDEGTSLPDETDKEKEKVKQGLIFFPKRSEFVNYSLSTFLAREKALGVL